ncbi:hypothetical protein [Rickettsiella endosymbiont of Dermanyssus gallinae]|uniref:hypothetical protein n=1 Tax=Rickettsiella endosymbiont of Dermanyssus gallinae TaxID=2856608 RepID=UPI001C532FCC|nr:hypothetical protein [Rickettsiella endosymbiont of Dermanyssus gallinae]
MSQSLPPNLVKATTGQYSIPIVAIYKEAWHRIKGMKKSFWGGFALLFLTLAGIYVVFQFFVTVCSVLQFYKVGAIGGFIAGGFFEVLRLLLSMSLVFLALQHLRHQAISSTMVFEFRKAWKPLTIIALSFYLLNFLLVTGGKLILNKVNTPGLENTFAFGMVIQFIVFVILFTYIAMLITMSMLLILDKKMSLKESFAVAFKSINQHVFKNIALLLLASLLFLGIGLVTLGIGLIWLLPFMSLISAIQYQQIFCQDESALGAR